MSWNQYNPPGNFWDDSWNRVPIPQYVNRGGGRGNNCYRPTNDNNYPAQQIENWFYEDNFECNPFDPNVPMSPPIARQNSYDRNRIYNVPRDSQTDRPYRGGYNPRGNHNSNSRGIVNRSLSRRPQPYNANSTRDGNFHSPAVSGSHHVSRIDSSDRETSKWNPSNPSIAGRDRNSPPPKRRRGSDSGSNSSSGLQRSNSKDHASPRRETNVSPRKAPHTLTTPSTSPKIIPLDRRVDTASSAGKSNGKDTAIPSSSRSVSSGQAGNNSLSSPSADLHDSQRSAQKVRSSGESSDSQRSKETNPGPSPNSSKKNSYADKETNDELGDLPDFTSTSKRIRRDSGDSDKTEVITREKRCKLPEKELEALKGYDQAIKEDWLSNFKKKIALTIPTKKPVTIKQEAVATPELDSSSSAATTSSSNGVQGSVTPQITCHEAAINPHQSAPETRKSETSSKKENSSGDSEDTKKAALISERRRSSHDSSASSSASGRESSKNSDKSKHNSYEKRVAKVPDKPETTTKEAKSKNPVVPVRNDHTVSLVKEFAAKVNSIDVDQNRGSYFSGVSSTTGSQQSHSKNSEVAKDGSDSTQRLSATPKGGSSSADKVIQLPDKQKEISEGKRAEEKVGEKSVSLSRNSASTSSSDVTKGESHTLKSSTLDLTKQLAKKKSNERIETNIYPMKAPSIPSSSPTTRGLPGQDESKETHLLSSSAAASSASKENTSDSSKIDTRSRNPSTGVQISKNVPAVQRDLVNVGGIERTKEASTNPSTPTEERNIALVSKNLSTATVNVQENLNQVKTRLNALPANKSSISPLTGASKLNDCTTQVAPLETISTNTMPIMEKGRNSNQPVVPLNSNVISDTSISLLGNVQPRSQNVSSNTAKSPLTDKTRDSVSVLTSSTAVVLALQNLRKTMDTNGIETALGGTVVDKNTKESQKPTQPAASSMPMSASLQKEPLNQANDLVQQVNATRDALASAPSVEEGQSSKPSKAVSDSSPQYLTPISAVKSGNVISSATVNRIRLEHKISPSAKEVVLLEPEKSLRSLLTTGTSTLELSPVVSGNTESVQSPRKINKFKESAQKLQQLVRSERLSKDSVESPDQNDNKSSDGEEIVILPNAMAALLGAGQKVREATLVENEVNAKLTEASGTKSIEKGAMPQKTRRQSIELITDDVEVVCLDNEPGDHSTPSKDDNLKNLASSNASEEKEDVQELISKPQNVVFPSHLITDKLPIVESVPSSKDVPNSSTDTPVTQKLSASSSIAGIGSSVEEKTNELEAPLVEENSILANLAGSNTTQTDVPLANGNILENNSQKDTTTSATMTQATVPLCESSIVSGAPTTITSVPHNISAGVRKEISDVVPEFAQFVEDDEDDDEIQVIEVFDKRNSFPRRRSQDRINELREKLAQRDKDTVPHATDMVLPKQSTTPPPNTAMTDNFPIPETSAPITVAQKSPSKIYTSMPELVEDIIVSALEASGTSLEEEMETGESHPATTSSDRAVPSMASLNSNEYSLSDLRISLTPPSTLNQSALYAPISAASVISSLVSAPVANSSEDNSSIVISSTVSLAEPTTEMNEGLYVNEVSCVTGSSSQKSAEDQSQPEFYPVMSILDAPKADTGIQCEIWKEDKVCSGCQSVKCMADKNCSEGIKCASDELCFPPNLQHYKKSVAGHVESMRRCVEECNSHLADWKEDGSPEEIYGKLKKMNDILRVRSHAIECRMASMEAAKIVPKELYRAQPVDHTKLLTVDGMSEYFRMLLQIEELPQIPEAQSSSNNAFILQVLRFRILRVLNYYCRQTPGAQDPSILNLLSCIISNPEYKRKIGAWSVEKIVAGWDAVKKYEGEIDKAAIEKEYIIGTKSIQKLVIMLTNCVLRQQGIAQRVANANAMVSNAQASTANSAAATTSGQYLQRLVVSPVTPSPPPNPAGTTNAGLQHVLTSRNNVQRGSNSAMNGIPQQVSENPSSSALRTVMTPVPQEASYGNQVNQNSVEQNPTVGYRVPNTRISSPVPSNVYVEATRTGNTNTQQPSERAGSPGGWTPLPGRPGALFRLAPDQPTQVSTNLATVTGVSQMFTASAPTSTSQFQSQPHTNARQTAESGSIQTPPLASPSYATAQGTENLQGSRPNASAQRVSVPQGSSGQRSYMTPQQHQLRQTLPSSPYRDLPQGTQLIRVPRTMTPQPGVTGVQHQVNNTQGHGGILYSQLSLQQQQLLLRNQQQHASNQQREQYHQRNQQAVQQQLFNQQSGQQQQQQPFNQQTAQYPTSNQQTVQQQQRQSNQRAPQFHGQQYQQGHYLNQNQVETHHEVSIIHHYPANQAANNIVGSFIATPSSASNATNQSNQRNNCPQVSQPSFGDVYLP